VTKKGRSARWKGKKRRTTGVQGALRKIEGRCAYNQKGKDWHGEKEQSRLSKTQEEGRDCWASGGLSGRGASWDSERSFKKKDSWATRNRMKERDNTDGVPLHLKG